jgi:hypothetical protein
VAVVLGARNTRQRAELAAELFTKGFEGSSGGLFGRFSAPETIDHMARGPEAGQPVRDMKPEICGKKRNDAPDPEEIGEAPRMADNRESGAVIKPGEAGWAPIKPVSYLTERFDIGPPVRVWVGGADAAPGDAGEMLALAPVSDPTALMAAPTFSTASAPGAIRPRPGDQPVLGAARADGGPLVIAAPGVIGGPAKPPVKSTTLAVASPPASKATAAKAKPAAAAAKAKPAAKPTAKPPAKAAAKPAAKPVGKPAPVRMPEAKPKKKSGG